MMRPLFSLGFTFGLFISQSALAWAGDYKDYAGFNSQLQRAFAVPSVTYELKTYKSYSSPTPSSSSGSSSSRSWLSTPAPSTNSWAVRSLPDMRESRPDPLYSLSMERIERARKSGRRPDITQSSSKQLHDFYLGFGVSEAQSWSAAYEDEREANGVLWDRYNAEKARQAQFQESERRNIESWRGEVRALRARTEGGDRGAIPALYQLAIAGIYQGTLTTGLRAETDEIMLFCAAQGYGVAIGWRFNLPAPSAQIKEQWRDEAARAGRVTTLGSLVSLCTQSAPTNYKRLAGVLETVSRQAPAALDLSHKEVPKALADLELTKIYARGDATLPADFSKALFHARQLPTKRPRKWEEYSYYYRTPALAALDENPALARRVEAEMLALWEESAREEPEDFDRQNLKRLAEIYSGTELAYPNAKNAAKMNALLAQIEAGTGFRSQAADREWMARFLALRGQWERAQKFYDELDNPIPIQISGLKLRHELGLFWRDRTDGKANPYRAATYFEATLREIENLSPSFVNFSYSSRPELLQALPLLIETFRKSGNSYALEKLLNKQCKDGDNFARPLAFMQRALFHYGGPAPSLSARAVADMSDARSLLEQIRERPLIDFEKPVLEPYLADLGRQIAFQSIAAPLRMRQRERAQQELAPDQLRRETAEDWQRAEPQLRALKEEYAPAKRLWAPIALAGGPKITPADGREAAAFLREAIRGGDQDALLLLAQWQFQNVASAPDPTAASLAEARLEAADLLELAHLSDDKTTRLGLAAIYENGWGRPRSLDQAKSLWRELAQEGDSAAQAKLAALIPTPTPKAVPKTDPKAPAKTAIKTKNPASIFDSLQLKDKKAAPKVARP